MTIDEVKTKITELSIMHSEEDDELDNLEITNYFEMEAEMLIADYCEERVYLIEGFPTLKRKEIDPEDQDEYFCRERYWLYFAKLTVTHEDVAELMWHYESSFFDTKHTSREDYVERVREELAMDGFYDIEF